MRGWILFLPFIVAFILRHPSFSLPPELFGLKYSDIAYGVFYMIFGDLRLFAEGGRWFNREVLESFSGSRGCPLPYVDYHFEYPPLVGLFWAISTCTSLMMLLPRAYDRSEYVELLPAIQGAHYVISALYLGTFYTIMLVALRRLVEPHRMVLLLLMPSFYLFPTYNWDIMAISLFVLSLTYYREGRFELAGLLSGLSISAKMLTVVAAIAMLAQLIRDGKRREAMRYLSYMLAGLSPFLLLYLAAPQGFTEAVRHHANWYCENCLTMVFIHNIWDERHRLISAALGGALSLLGIFLILSGKARLERLLFALVSAPIAFNYVFTPQMMLITAPVALASLSGLSFIAYMIAEAFNAAGLVAFFPDESRWTMEGEAQKLWAVRNVIMAGVVIAQLLSPLAPADLFRYRDHLLRHLYRRLPEDLR